MSKYYNTKRNQARNPGCPFRLLTITGTPDIIETWCQKEHSAQHHMRWCPALDRIPPDDAGKGENEKLTNADQTCPQAESVPKRHRRTNCTVIHEMFSGFVCPIMCSTNIFRNRYPASSSTRCKIWGSFPAGVGRSVPVMTGVPLSFPLVFSGLGGELLFSSPRPLRLCGASFSPVAQATPALIPHP